MCVSKFWGVLNFVVFRGSSSNKNIRITVKSCVTVFLQLTTTRAHLGYMIIIIIIARASL